MKGRAVVVLLLLLHAILLLDGARRDTVTFDEVTFIPGGVARWQSGDPRLSPECGEIPLRLAGLLPHAAGATVDRTSAAWRVSDSWPLGRPIVESPQGGQRMVLLARLPIAAASVLLGLLTFLVARRLLGHRAALLALLLHALSPVMLSHGRLATADVAFTLSLLAATWALARLLEHCTPMRVAMSCLATATCFLVKFSALLLLPIAGMLVAIRLLDVRPWPVHLRSPLRSRSSRAALLAVLLFGHAAVTFSGIWLAFGLRQAALHDQDAPAGHDAPAGASLKEGGWPAVAGTGALARAIETSRRHGLLPEAWLYGLAFTMHHAEERPAFALGRWSVNGWPWYFPLALALKTPLATLVLVGLGVTAFPLAWRAGRRATLPLPGDDPAMRPWSADLLALAPLLALLAVYWGAALTASLNIGVRHVLPTLPATFILASAAAGLRGSRALHALVAVLAGLAAAEGLLGHPLHLAHMNPLAGPPERRWSRLTDSNLDWGQDARRAAGWMEEELPGDIYLAWFGLSNPGQHGARAAASLRLDGRTGIQAPLDLGAGVYVVSATALVQVYGGHPGPWCAAYEEEWQRIDARVRAVIAGEAPAAGEWQSLVRQHGELRLARLCAWLRQRPPGASIGGGAVLAWRLTAEDVRQALHDPPAEAPPLQGVADAAGAPSAP